jgi:Zn-dependent peptidase ImmA (M78 family)
LGDDWGDTGLITRKGQKFLMIRINRRLSEEAQIMVCLHELGHALQWRVNEDERQSDHDPEFGIAYSRLWSELMGN